MAEDSLSVERLEELEEVNTRLQLLVGELLLKNQELRIQLAGSQGWSSRGMATIHDKLGHITTTV